MTTYADPTRCPDCHSILPPAPSACPACGLPLTGVTAVALFETFQEADRLLARLRDQAAQAVLATMGGRPAAAPPRQRRVPSSAAPVPSRPSGSRLRGGTVPQVLLSLGALCLLVAAVAFLAVAWSWLGVAGRTVVLVGLTGVSLGLSVALTTRGLRMAAEALSVVGLGLLALDVVGMRHAGWLGHVDDARLTMVVGAVVATGALMALVVTADRPLAAPGVVAPVAVIVGTAGAQWRVDAPVPLVVGLAALVGLGRVGTTLPSRALLVTSLAVGTPSWLVLVGAGVHWAGDPITVHHYWGEGAVWPLAVAVLLAAILGPATGARSGVDVAGYAVAALTGSVALVLPTLDNARTGAVAALLAFAVVWVALVALAPPKLARLRPAGLVPIAGTLVVPGVALVHLVAESGRATLSVGAPFTRSFDVHVVTSPTAVAPWLLVPILLALAGAACATAALVAPLTRTAWGAAGTGALVVGGIVTPPLYDVPLAVVVAAPTALAVVALLGADRYGAPTAHRARLSGLVLITGAALVALPNDRITAAVLAVACGMVGYLMMRDGDTGAVASLCFPIAFTGLVWATGHALGVDGQFRAVPVLIVLGGLVIWRPQMELELSAALSGAVASAGAILSATDMLDALAVHLTITGVLVTATSIIHRSRRVLAWPGGLLLAGATWARLAELGIHTPEAYTLPSALVLIAVGGWRLRLDERSSTLTFLAPGLTLATVPSLLATLGDPYSWRALLLGACCLALVLGGVGVRWSAPVVIGSAVGSVLVLRELAPYAAQVPTWLTIGLSGSVLLLVGITWESRMNDVRRAGHYLAALR